MSNLPEVGKGAAAPEEGEDKNRWKFMQANLNPLEKILKEVLQRQIVKNFKESNIIPPGHHSGRQQHSTITVKMKIDENASNRMEDCHSSIVLATDLSRAYNVIKHDLLLCKLKFHGV